MLDVKTPNHDIVKVFEGYLNIAYPKMFATEIAFERKFKRFMSRKFSITSTCAI